MKYWLRFHNAMLVGEVIPACAEFHFAKPWSPDIPVYEQVLVDDEYQDMNKAERALITPWLLFCQDNLMDFRPIYLASALLVLRGTGRPPNL